MSIVTSVLPKVFNYAERAFKVYPAVVFGARGQDVMTKAYADVFKAQGGVKFSNLWSGLKEGTKSAGKAAEKYAGTFAGKGFLATAKASIVSIPAKVAQGWRVGGKLAAKKGASSIGQFFGSAKGALAGLGKKLPVIGSLILVACELPNIFRATKNEGLGSGAVETGKAAARIGAATVGASAGAAIGSAICPGIGTAIGGIIGWIAGEWGAKKVVGKSYSEKQEEQQQKIQEAVAEQTQLNAAVNTVQSPYNAQYLAQLEQMLYPKGSRYSTGQALNFQA